MIGRQNDFSYPSAVAAHLYGFGNRRREEGEQWMQIHAREVIILPSIILPVLLLRAGPCCDQCWQGFEDINEVSRSYLQYGYRRWCDLLGR